MPCIPSLQIRRPETQSAAQEEGVDTASFCHSQERRSLLGDLVMEVMETVHVGPKVMVSAQSPRGPGSPQRLLGAVSELYLGSLFLKGWFSE